MSRGRFRSILRACLKWGLRLTFMAILLFCLAWIAFPFPGARLERTPSSVRILDREGATLRVLLGPGDSLQRPLEGRISENWVARALVAAEDKRFYRHPGVDPAAMLRAMKQNVGTHRIVSGASTLSTQLMRMTKPRARILPVKIEEAFRALQMETLVGKEDILRHYLDRAPFGGNLVGAEAAGQWYFGKASADLTLGEAALLAGLPQSPSRFRPDRHLGRALKRRVYVLDRMQALGMISGEQRRAADRQPINLRRRLLPFHAPHFCEWVMNEAPDAIRRASVNGGGVRTTLDPALQAAAERCIRDAAPELTRKDIYALAAVVVEVRSGAVRAMVGSPDYFGASGSAQVNHALRPRSAGSTLKPFLYALAMDRGSCRPETRLTDSPRYYHGYEPGNFDLGFRGSVTARQALGDSLNIPALILTERCGLERFHHLLRDLGLDTVSQPPEHYGLSLALGTAEVRLLDLANAYACLARMGLYRPCTSLEDAEPEPGRQLLGAEACWLVADILGAPDRQALLYGSTGGSSNPRAAWKTGTSNGYRDAWAVAYDPRYVVAVWAGNSDGRGAPGLVGLDAAAPLAGALFSAVCGVRPGPWFEQPPGIVERNLCGQTGLLRGPTCRQVVPGSLILGRSLPDICNRCVDAADDTEPATRYQPEKRLPLRILFPNTGDVFRLLEHMPGLRQEISLRSTSSGTSHWYADGHYLGSAEPTRALNWPMNTGRHILACCDDQGRSARVMILVE